MGELGSIFDDLPVVSGDKGPDARVTVVVRRAEVEAGQAVLVPVPDLVPFAGGTVPRRREAGDPPGAVRLHLSPRLVAGSTLRLRRQGGEHPVSGVPGDLLVELDIAAPPRRSPFIAVAVALAAAAAVAWGSYGVWWGAASAQ